MRPRLSPPVMSTCRAEAAMEKPSAPSFESIPSSNTISAPVRGIATPGAARVSVSFLLAYRACGESSGERTSTLIACADDAIANRQRTTQVGRVVRILLKLAASAALSKHAQEA